MTQLLGTRPDARAEAVSDEQLDAAAARIRTAAEPLLSVLR